MKMEKKAASSIQSLFDFCLFDSYSISDTIGSTSKKTKAGRIGGKKINVHELWCITRHSAAVKEVWESA